MVAPPLTHLFIAFAYLRWAVEAEPCNSRQNRTTSAPKTNIWNELSDAETAGLDDFVHGYINSNTTISTGLWNQTGDSDSTKPSLNLLYEFMLPTKAEALVYLDGNGSAPARFARFSVPNDNYLQLYSVGPLPLSKGTRVHALKSIPGPPLLAEMNYTQLNSEDQFVKNLTADMQDILSDLIGKVRTNNEHACCEGRC
jgi:hypothetical protein